MIRAISAIVVLTGFALQSPAAPLNVVENGKSNYSIYADPQSPSTVQRAARELQETLEKATGAKLPVVATPVSPMISLGVNQSSREAGLDKDLPEIGFRVATKGSDLFILGNDTPDGQEKWMGQARRGTMLGTFDFLEKCAN